MILIYSALGILLALVILLIFLVLQSRHHAPDQALMVVLSDLHKSTERAENAMKAEFATGRGEAARNARDVREELAGQLDKLTHSNEDKLEKLRQSIELKLIAFQNNIDANAKDNRKELKDNLTVFTTGLNQSLKDFGDRQRENFSSLIETQNIQSTSQTEKLSEMNNTIKGSLKSLQEDNGARLEKMRETVDEKLQKTLETRLTQSFETVSKHLESVQKGLGEMQLLAVGVGDLKRVLTNVKTRGVLGEYQLENILEQLLTPDQYGKNVKTKQGSNALVEFAIKMPGGTGSNNSVWLPIDSKFPKEDFELMVDAYDQGNLPAIEVHRRAFVKGIRKCAGDICEKYVDPPNTTDFGILFLPFESLYAEVLRTPGLFESIQRECKITITGPTTLSALLNSLQMGFRTLAITQRSSEVWDLLGGVKTEFGKFGIVLDQTQKKLQEAGNFIEKASVRSRAIERKLKNVQELPGGTAAHLLGDLAAEEEEEKEEE